MERRGLTCGALLQLFDFAGEAIVAIVEIADLLFEFLVLLFELLYFLAQFFDGSDLPQNNFDELVWLLL